MAANDAKETTRPVWLEHRITYEAGLTKKKLNSFISNSFIINSYEISLGPIKNPRENMKAYYHLTSGWQFELVN